MSAEYCMCKGIALTVIADVVHHLELLSKMSIAQHCKTPKFSRRTP